MRSALQKAFFMCILLIFPLALYAQNECHVCDWVKKTLTDIFTIDYNSRIQDDPELKATFSLTAQSALYQFLGDSVPKIKKGRLSITPVFITEPYVAKQGTFSGIQFWRVNETIDFPQLNVTIKFSLIVIETNPSPYGSYMVQSMDMYKQQDQ